MTEKRFTETVSTGIVTDNQTGKEYNCEMRISDEFLELVNDINEGLEYHRRMHEKWKEEALDNSKKVTIICTEEDIIKKLKGDDGND